MKDNDYIQIQLNDESKQSIEHSTGLTFSELERMSAEEIDTAIEKKIKKRLTWNLRRNDTRLPFRGSVYLTMKRFITFNADKKLSKI